MGEAVRRLQAVAGDAIRADKWQTAKRMVSAYVEGLAADLDELAGEDVLTVDAAVDLLATAAGCRDLGKLVKRQLVSARRAKLRPASRGVDAPVTLADILPGDAPGRLDQLVMPSGYLLLADGVAGPPRPESDERPLVSGRPVYLSAIVRSVTDGEYHADVVWQAPDGRWEVGTFARHVLADSRALVKLARRGLPVDSGTASALVREQALQSPAPWRPPPPQSTQTTVGAKRGHTFESPVPQGRVPRH